MVQITDGVTGETVDIPVAIHEGTGMEPGRKPLIAKGDKFFFALVFTGPVSDEDNAPNHIYVESGDGDTFLIRGTRYVASMHINGIAGDWKFQTGSGFYGHAQGDCTKKVPPSYQAILEKDAGIAIDRYVKDHPTVLATARVAYWNAKAARFGRDIREHEEKIKDFTVWREAAIHRAHSEFAIISEIIKRAAAK